MMSIIVYLMIGFMAGSLFVTFTSPKSDKEEELK
jgi:F0F1-type ATP synthase assembly protein I